MPLCNHTSLHTFKNYGTKPLPHYSKIFPAPDTSFTLSQSIPRQFRIPLNQNSVEDEIIRRCLSHRNYNYLNTTKNIRNIQTLINQYDKLRTEANFLAQQASLAQSKVNIEQSNVHNCHLELRYIIKAVKIELDKYTQYFNDMEGYNEIIEKLERAEKIVSDSTEECLYEKHFIGVLEKLQNDRKRKIENNTYDTNIIKHVKNDEIGPLVSEEEHVEENIRTGQERFSKKKLLKQRKEEIEQLTQTKSQMVWLLKQVILAEKMRKTNFMFEDGDIRKKNAVNMNINKNKMKQEKSNEQTKIYGAKRIK